MQINNNIKSILEEREISMLQMSKDLDWTYDFAWKIASREDLGTTQLSTLTQIANYLDVTVDDLFEEVKEVEETYTYGYKLRPPSPGCQPKGFKKLKDEAIMANNRSYWGVVTYDRPLTEKEAYSYDLDFLGEEVQE